MRDSKDIFEYIIKEEAAFELPVDVNGWNWSMKDHLKTSFFYKHGRLLTGNDVNKPVKNIIKPILNLQYRTEDIDVKNILLYVENEDKFHLSFLIKKYHDDVYLKEYNLDDFIDVSKEEQIDYGAVLVEDIDNGVPEIHHLQTIAFCDQTDILSGPLCFKYYLSPDQLMEMKERGWGEESNGADISLDDLLVLSQDNKETKKSKDGIAVDTPGKYVEIYRISGSMPAYWLEGEDDKFLYQTQIVAFYKDTNNDKQGVCLFKKKDKKNRFKLYKRDPIHGRALGWGGVEELFEPQVWVNYDKIQKKQMLDAASKVILQTDDEGFESRNKTKNLQNLQLAILEDGKRIAQVDTFPRNSQLFDQSTLEWEAHAQQMGAANDSIMGKNPNSGTPFALQELVTDESRGLHDYRRGKFAKWLEEVYRDFIIPKIIREITKGAKFLSTLSIEEMQEVADRVTAYEAFKYQKEKVLNGETFNQEEVEAYKQKVRDSFTKDNKKFIEILKDEFSDMAINISINIAGKQKELGAQVQKLGNIFRQIISAPQVLDDPRMAKIFNQILESSGLSPIDFASKPQMPLQQQPMQAGAPIPQEPMPQANLNQLI